MFARLASSGLLQIRPLRQLEHPREVIRQFTPNWFAVTMGTGILALALPQLPLPGMQLVGRTLWLINIGLFCLFMLLYAARWLFFFHEAKRVFAVVVRRRACAHLRRQHSLPDVYASGAQH